MNNAKTDVRWGVWAEDTRIYFRIGVGRKIVQYGFWCNVKRTQFVT